MLFNESLTSTRDVDDRRIAIFGASGYVGSYLALYLNSAGLKIISYDMDPKVHQPGCTKMHSNSIESRVLETFEFVIFLGGCTGRLACAAQDRETTQKMNVDDVIRLVKKMSPHQHLIIASTSAVTEGWANATEKDPIFVEKLDEYSSSMYRRELSLKKLSLEVDKVPRVSMLRFGTVVGVSSGQRTDLLVPSLYKSAYTKGVLNVKSFSKMRSFLWLDDLSRAVKTIIRHTSWHDMEMFNVWNLASFSATVLKVAATVSSITGASIDTSGGIEGVSLKFLDSEFEGFSLNCESFKTTFDFSFNGDLQNVMTEFDQNVPDSITAKGAHASVTVSESIPCPVCGSGNQQLVLDLGSQPFANDFFPNKSQSLNLSRYPLKLVRCRVCNHLHLSHIASRETLFVHYLYRSGTSKTLAAYFEWLSNLVIEDSGNKRDGTVLEIACNDGSQLDEFAKRGWRTFGVDPAANIAPIAQKKGHNVKIGFWDEHIQLEGFPQGDALTAIVAQNVFAHVPNPVGFLKACAAIMGSSTILYIQTSQCNMHQLGQFDTAYHEHISFFTGHSFLKASELAGLYITSFRTTPIHGTSCLVTMKLPILSTSDTKRKTISETLQERLDSEKDVGITTDFFYERYAARAQVTRTWIIEQIKNLRKRGYNVGAYGAAAKGMTLLHYIFDDAQFQGTTVSSPSHQWIDFVLDDAPLKQNTYCPGTVIPVYPTSFLTVGEYTNKLVIIIFAWNFWEEIATKIKAQLRGSAQSDITILLPFPTPKLLRLRLDKDDVEELRDAKYKSTPIPNIYHDTKRKRIGLVTHQRNEEMLIPFFILHHSPMFDHATLIDFKSNDSTRELINKYAPASWKVVESTTGHIFDANQTDSQVMYWENQHPKDWAIALTTTEFLVFDDLRRKLFDIQPDNSYPYIHRFNCLLMVGNDTKPLRHFSSLIEQRHQFYIHPDYYEDRWKSYGRVLHLNSVNYEYSLGRHVYAPTLKPNSTGTELDGFLVKWYWTPWPESALRKTKVGETIPKVDSKIGNGKQHTKWFDIGKNINNIKELEKKLSVYHARKIAKYPRYDLCNGPIDDLNATIRFSSEKFNVSLDLGRMQKIFYSVTGNMCIN